MAAPRETQHVSRTLPSATRWLLFAGLLVASWCVMAFTHEAGHIVGGWIGGGTLRHAELRPWRLPHSMFDPDPRPLLTLWSGPLFGAAVPLAFAWIVRRPWMWFIAHFSILANGCYLATAWMAGDPFLDTPRMFDAGAQPVSVLSYCVVTIGFGYRRFRDDCVAVLRSGRQAV